MNLIGQERNGKRNALVCRVTVRDVVAVIIVARRHFVLYCGFKRLNWSVAVNKCGF
jgi:hypothetical protein